MAEISANLQGWSDYNWTLGGEEWSEPWGGSEYLWWRTVYPRIIHFLPTDHILEIAPGFGRFSQYLKNQCRHLTLVDLTPKCIEACRARFKSSSHIDYVVNDGKSFPTIPESSVDFIFTFDSLVHANVEVFQDYLKESARILKPTGAAFFHHSNIGVYRDQKTGQLTVSNEHWRDESMQAEVFADLCKTVGLTCLVQEKINWRVEEFNDCFSLAGHKKTTVWPSNQVFENPKFMEEADNSLTISKYYHFNQDKPSLELKNLVEPAHKKETSASRTLMDTLVWEIPFKYLTKAVALKIVKRFNKIFNFR